MSDSINEISHLISELRNDLDALKARATPAKERSLALDVGKFLAGDTILMQSTIYGFEKRLRYLEMRLSKLEHRR